MKAIFELMDRTPKDSIHIVFDIIPNETNNDYTLIIKNEKCSVRISNIRTTEDVIKSLDEFLNESRNF